MSNRNDVRVALLHHMIVDRRMFPTRDGYHAAEEIYDETISRFFYQNTDRDYWEHPKFREFILKVVGEIAEEAKTRAGGGGTPMEPRVTRPHVVDATEEVFGRYKAACRQMLAEVRKGTGSRFFGDICGETYKELKRMSAAS